MTSDHTLVVIEDGERTGHITADGEIGYTGDTDYVQMVLERFEGGEIVTYRTGDSEGPFRAGVEADRNTGEELFESVRARLAPLPDIEVVESSDGTELSRDSS